MLDNINIIERRYRIYDLLSYAFMNEPDEKLLSCIEELNELFKDVIGEDINFIKIMKLEDLIQEYYDRFFVNSSSLYVPPFESAIRNMKINNGKVKYGELDSKDTFHVKTCYEMVNFKPNKLNMFLPLKNNYFPDHIGFEIGFMTFMVNKEFNCLKNDKNDLAKDWRNLQKQFLKDHLLTWIGDYSELLSEKSKGLYSYLAKLSSIWIDLDFEYISEE